MRKWRVQFFLMGIMVAVFISNGPGISQAAHFSLTGTSSIHVSKTKSITLTGACNSAMDVSTPSDSTTIQPDPGESVGQAVTVNYCYSGSGTTSVTGAGYRAAGGIGSSTLTASCPFSYSNPNPLVALLNPGPSQQTVFSYGPQTITGIKTSLCRIRAEISLPILETPLSSTQALSESLTVRHLLQAPVLRHYHD